VKRRDFITLLGGAAAARPLAARAQQTERMRRVGVLMATIKDDPVGTAEITAFRQGLAELGWIEGRNIGIDVRWPGGNIELIEALAKELVRAMPDVLVSRSTPTTTVLKRESGAVPIVFVNIAEAVEQGFVQSLARPGGNLTGFTNSEASVGGKMLQLLKEIDPRIVRVAVMYNPQTAPFYRFYTRSMESAAPGLGIEVVAMPVQSPTNIETGMAEFGRHPGGGLVVLPDAYLGQEHRELVVSLAAANHLPALYANRITPSAGGLLTYGVDARDLMHRAADYVDRILKGAKPSDLPVQLPTKYELIINLKTAKSLGLTVPPSLLAIADEVIE
jgi:putative ABC transport system substrate-binding protein